MTTWLYKGEVGLTGSVVVEMVGREVLVSVLLLAVVVDGVSYTNSWAAEVITVKEGAEVQVEWEAKVGDDLPIPGGRREGGGRAGCPGGRLWSG